MWLYLPLLFLLTARTHYCAVIDVVDCGVDNNEDVTLGDVDINQYPWLGVLYYMYHGESGDIRAVTPVVLIHVEFVAACAADIGPMPKHNFRSQSRVLLGENWRGLGRRVSNYVLHPEYGETLNTLALVQLKDKVRTPTIKHLCPPPEILKNPTFYIMRFKDEYSELVKEVLPASHVPAKMCKDFYVQAKLYDKRRRPAHAACAVSLRSAPLCVWPAGAVLLARDVWGRWQLLGLSVRGPGCSAPSRYLDLMSYYQWIQLTLESFRSLTITKITDHQYVLRASKETTQKYGACDEEERINLIYRDNIKLVTDSDKFQMFTYNLSMYQSYEYSCVIMKLVNATATSEMKIRQMCTRYSYGPACYTYKGTAFQLTVYLTIKESCEFDIRVYGWPKNMTLLDIQTWKFEEGTYYEDFTMSKVEYKGPLYETEFGYEPVDEKLWVPEYDIWTTTSRYVTDKYVTTTEIPKSHDDIWEAPPGEEGYDYKPTRSPNQPFDFDLPMIIVKPRISTTIEPGTSTTIEPGNSTTIELGNSTTIEPGNSTTIEPDNSTTIEPGNWTTMKPYDTTTMEPDDTTTMEPDDTTTVMSDFGPPPDYFFE